NLGTPLGFTPPTPVSGVPVSAAESDFDDLGVEETHDAVHLPPSPAGVDAAPMLSAQVELPGLAAPPAPAVQSATTSIDTAIAATDEAGADAIGSVIDELSAPSPVEEVAAPPAPAAASFALEALVEG